MTGTHDLGDVLAELLPLEPIFHTTAFGTTRDDFDSRMADDYWEVGASGKRYDRAFILHHLALHPPVLAEKESWHLSEHAILPLAPEVYLLTYLLHQPGRITRRSTLWQRSGDAWQVLYHQGTIVED